MTLGTEIFAEVFAERIRQEQKFPDQHLPSASIQRIVPSADYAKDRTNSAFETGTASWEDVLVEEVCEAVDEAQAGDTAKLRVELIQVAAVAFRWIWEIDQQATA